MGQKEAIVCDTNVLVSALGWRGPERQLYDACRRERVRLITSAELLDELGRTLHYPKLGFSEDEIAAFQVDLHAHARLVQPTVEISVIKADSDDNRVLECAVTARAYLIVSGDRHLLELDAYEGYRSSTPDRRSRFWASAEGLSTHEASALARSSNRRSRRGVSWQS